MSYPFPILFGKYIFPKLVISFVSVIIKLLGNQIDFFLPLHVHIEYGGDQTLLRKIRALVEHMSKIPLNYKVEEIRKYMYFPLKMVRLERDSVFRYKYPNFDDDLRKKPVETLMCLGLAAYQLVQRSNVAQTIGKTHDGMTQESAEVIDKLSLLPIRARIYDFGPIVNLVAMKQDVYECMVTVRGLVIRVNSASLKCSCIAYRCPKCKMETVVRRTGDLARCVKPNECESGCAVPINFDMVHNSPKTQTESIQTIRYKNTAHHQ